jgi:hypothetical protein
MGFLTLSVVIKPGKKRHLTLLIKQEESRFDLDSSSIDNLTNNNLINPNHRHQCHLLLLPLVLL